VPGNPTTQQIMRVMATAVKASAAGDHAAAVAAWQRCFELDDGSDAAVRGDPDLPPLRLHPYFTYADYLRTRGDVAVAIGVLEGVIVRWPDDADAHRLMGQCYEQQKDWERTAACLQRSLEISPSAPGCVLLANAIGHLHRRDEALQWLRRALTIDPRYEEAYFNLGCAADRDGNAAEAIDYLSRAIEIDPEYALAHARLGEVFCRRANRDHDDDRTHADWARAFEHLSRAIALDPSDGWSHEYLAVLCEAVGRLADSEAHHQAATQLLPAIGVVWANYGHFHWQHGDHEQGGRLLRHAVSVDPDDSSTYFMLGKYLWDTGHHADARTELRHAHRLGHRRALAWLRERESER
jgi:tetratricopeptide (TPR) repeat protein